MNKGILALGAMLIFGVNTSSNAAKVCVFDLLGKSGEVYKMIA